MTSMELFRALGGISTENLAGAEKLQRVEAVSLKRKPSVKRAVLVAAVIALLLMLVGCAAVYVLHLQDLKVGEYRLIPTPVYDENGDVIPVGTHPLRTEISLQGANQEALMEWKQFTKEYVPSEEPDILAKNRATAVPDNYRNTYGCRYWEMMEKLDEITEKYDLKLLSQEIDCDSYQSGVLFGALGIDPVFQGNAEYLDSYFFPEGTFQVCLLFQLDSELWPYENNHAWYYFSQKAYFDLHQTSIENFENCTQWNYTRRDGKKLLLAMNQEEAWIFMDRPDAFITISFASFKWEGDEKVQMSQKVLEEIGEHFVLDIRPQAVDMNQVAVLQAEAEELKAAEDAKREEAAQNAYTQGYEAYIQYELDKTAGNTRQQDSLYYSLYDVNGDGIDELLSSGKKNVNEILSLRDGESYQYADFFKMNLFGIWQMTVCQDNVLALYDLLSERYWYFLRAEADGVSYLEGLEKEYGSDVWYSLPEQPPASPQKPVKVEITAEQAQAIQDSYVPLEDQPERQQMKRYGEPVKQIPWTDPYARYIAEILEQYSDPENFTYTLMDLNGDGVKELITNDAWTIPAGQQEAEYSLAIHTIVDGEVVTVSEHDFNGVCEGGIFMHKGKDHETDDYYTYFDFYRMEGTQMKMIEKVCQDPFDLYWGRVLYGDSGPDLSHAPCSEEEAMEFINAYKPIELPMKPFADYPFS